MSDEIEPSVHVHTLSGYLSQLRKIGREIASLMQESKGLRELIVKIAESQYRLGIVGEENPVKFICEGSVVSLVKAKGNKDYSVTFEDLVEIGSQEPTKP